MDPFQNGELTMTRLTARSHAPARRWLAAGLAVFAALSAGACERALQVAPSASVLVLSAPVTALPLNGTLNVTATLTDGAGAPVADGTLVTFAASLGTVNPSEARISNGRATVTYNAGATSGLATVSASSGGVSSNVLSVRVGPVPASILINASTSGTTATIMASVYDASGRAIAGTPVSFTTTAGTLSTSTVNTDAFGQATNTLFGTTDAIVTATAGGYSASVAVRFTFNGALSVNLTINPASPKRRDNVVFTATVGGFNNQPVFVQRYEWLFSDGVVVTTTGNQTVRAFLAEGNYSVTVRVTTIDGIVGLSRIEFHVD